MKMDRSEILYQIQYNGFYYCEGFSADFSFIDCIKLFENGTVKRIPYPDSITSKTHKIFDDENIEFDTGNFKNDNNGFTIYINTKRGTIKYGWVDGFDGNDLYFDVTHPDGFIPNRHYVFYKNCNYGSKGDNKKKYGKRKMIQYTCICCNYKFGVLPKDDFNTFACKKCHSIFSYEWQNDKLLIKTIVKNEYIPEEIKKILEYFEYNENSIELNVIKKKYHKLLSQYHPDKVSTLGSELKELADRKTKEIISNFEKLNDWINKKPE
jgi:hypothetical protein